MNNIKQVSGDVMTFVAPTGGVTSGQGVLVESLFGVAVTDAAQGAEVECITKGVVELTALNTATANKFAKAYWDATNKRVTNVAADNYKIGVFAVAKGSGPVVAQVRLDGVALTVEPGA